MATKAQLIAFIVENFSQSDGDEVSKSKLDGCKKAELEEFIKDNGLEDELKAWLAKQ